VAVHSSVQPPRLLSVPPQRIQRRRDVCPE